MGSSAKAGVQVAWSEGLRQGTMNAASVGHKEQASSWHLTGFEFWKGSRGHELKSTLGQQRPQVLWPVLQLETVQEPIPLMKVKTGTSSIAQKLFHEFPAQSFSQRDLQAFHREEKFLEIPEPCL